MNTTSEVTQDALAKRLAAALARIDVLEKAAVQYVNTVWEAEGVTFVDAMLDEELQKVIIELMNPYFALTGGKDDIK